MTFHNQAQEQLQILESISNHQEKLLKILEIYLELFPILNCHLYRYSALGFLGEGIVSVTSGKVEHIRQTRKDIRSWPIIYSAVREKRAKFSSGTEFLKQVNTTFQIPAEVFSLLVVPVRSGSVVIGYICSSKFLEGTIIDESMLSSLTLFGKLAGESLEKSSSDDYSQILSNRELEVMKRISWGESTKEMAALMNISELTVKHYVKSAIKKLGAHNRSHAVSKLLRQGIIT